MKLSKKQLERLQDHIDRNKTRPNFDHRHQTKVSEEICREIRVLYNDRGLSRKEVKVEIKDRFGVDIHETTVQIHASFRCQHGDL